MDVSKWPDEQLLALAQAFVGDLQTTVFFTTDDGPARPPESLTNTVAELVRRFRTREPRHTLRVAMDEQQFRSIVAGGVAVLSTAAGERVELILSDIGFDRMRAAIDKAQGLSSAD
jgi:hypothetical protein